MSDAKNRLTEVINLALSEGPQEITRRGDRLYLVKAEDFEAQQKPKLSFKEHLLNMPKCEELDLERQRDTMREVHF